jgi:hypothetical protein
MSPTSYQTAPPRISIIATLGGSVKRRAKAELSHRVIEGVIARIMIVTSNRKEMPANRIQTSGCVRRVCVWSGSFASDRTEEKTGIRYGSLASNAVSC